MIWINVQGSQSCKSEENRVIEGKSMDRRTFLSRVLIGGTATMSPTWSAAQGDTMFPGILLVDGVTLRTPASGLFSFLDPIISQNVPVCIAVRADHENLQEPEAGADLMRLLSTLITDYPGLVDLALELPDLALRHPYLRMRDASEARNWFRRSLLAATGQDAPAAVPETIVTRLPDGEIPVIEGLRSAGILNSILLPEDGTTPEIWRNSDATQQINGGWRLPPSPSGEDLLTAFSRAASNDAPTVFAAAFPTDPLIGDKNLFDQGSVIGDAFSRNLISGRSYLILPSELRFRSGEVFARHLVLCIRADDYGAAKDSLGARFTAAGMPFTEIGGSLVAAQQEAGAASTTIAKDTRHGCVVVSGAGGGGWNEARGLAFGSLAKDAERGAGGIAACAALDVSDDNASLEGQQAGFDVVLDLSKREGQPVGFDDHGSLRVHVSLLLEGRMAGQSAQAMRKSIEDAGSARADIIVLINGKGFSEPDAASALVEALSGLGKTGQFDLLDLPQYLAAVSVKSEQARLLRVASRWPARPYVNDIDTAERDLLMEDARLAWSYFEQLTDPKTGLVPATAWIEGDQVQAYQYSTMWDTGSLILGILSAHSIGLLTATQFYERIDAVLRGLATGVFDGLRLPKGLTSTDGRATGNDEYNASDTARLLVSLHLLRSYSNKDLGVAGIVERWDLAKTIRDGIPLTVSGGSLVSSYRSNYAGYIERAFRIWGYPVTSPYSDPGPGSPFDRGVHILHEVADFGPVGTEPHLLEAVELGASDLARAASDALFAAQVEEYRSTGKLVCVSEGPVNRAPWFVYQGFQIGDDKVDWTVETLDPSPIFQTKGFIRAVDMLNSKAAFLWNSCRPGDYSDLLIAQIREKAKVSSLGFSPGVFATTGKPDQAYSDINTNGVILQAIAYRLIGGKPGVDWTWKV